MRELVPLDAQTAGVMNSPRRLSISIALLIIVLVTAAVFSPVVTFDFTSWDDYDTVARNPLLNPPTARSIEAFWTRPHGDLYIPATYTLWFLAAELAQQQPAPSIPFTLDPHLFHALNLLLHIGIACVVFLLLEILFRCRAASLIGALLFAVHPVQVESVAWVSGMKDVLFGLLSLVAIWQYLLAAHDSQTATANRRRGRYAIATLVFILAMLAKPTAMVVPLIVIVLDRLMLGRTMRQVLRSVWPWLVLAVPCAVATKICQPAPLAHDAAAALWARPLIAADAMAFYLYKLAWPATLTFDYGRTPESVIKSGMIAWTWILPTAIGVFAWRMRKRAPAVACGAALTVIVLLPVLGLVPFDFQIYSTVADHYLYLALLGLAMIVAWMLSGRPSNTTFALVACVIAAMGARSFMQTAHWRDSRALFTHGREVNPESFASYNSLAALALDENQPDQAIDLIRQALAIRPYAASYLTYGEAMRRKGQPDAAIAAFRESLRREPDYAPALNNLAALLAEQGRLDEALPVGQQAVKASPQSVTAHLNLGRMYFQTNNAAAARREFLIVLQLDPANTIARDFLAELSPK